MPPSAADLIISMFEGAIKAKPNSEDVLSHLFMSYVRTSDYKKQKDIALQLYKIKEHTPFYLWAVMSIVMQVRAFAPRARALYSVCRLWVTPFAFAKFVFFGEANGIAYYDK